MQKLLQNLHFSLRMLAKSPGLTITVLLTLAFGIGLAIGLIGAYFIGRAMQTMLYGVGTIDYSAFASVGAILLTASLIACYFPARRAASVEPMQVLRNE